MEDSKKYTAFSIPQRSNQIAHEESLPVRGVPAGDTLFTDTRFAEIEIEAAFRRIPAAESALRFFSSVTPAQPIEQMANDPVRQKFYEMRRLASNKPFSRNDSDLFYRQAKFMEDYTDDYEGDAKFIMYFPYYQHMGAEQLRTYFTWRTKVRQGEIQPVSVSYAFLYVYELLSGIGVTDPLDGLRKLVAIWDGFLKYGPALENHMPRWFKDYHVYYELPHSFEEFVKEYKMQRYYSLSLILDTDEEENLELWNSISGYDVTKSKYYSDGNEQLFQDCFSAVLTGIREFYESREAHFENVLVYRVSNKTPWYPFRQALFYNWLDQPDRNVRMPGQERYYCQNNRWTASLPLYYSTQRDFVGYIIKKMESCLRKIMKYKYALSADMKTGSRVFRELKELDASTADLDKVIEKAVGEFHRDTTRTIVTVDHMNLARIRKEAMKTTEKLIVPEEVVNSEFGIRNSELEDSEQITNHKSQITNQMSSSLRDDEDNAATRESNKQYTSDNSELSEQIQEGWVAFKAALSPIELKALTIALTDSAGVKVLADENGIMLEVLADSINEKAVDYIGDNILETDGGMMIYDEYKANIAEMMGNPPESERN